MSGLAISHTTLPAIKFVRYVSLSTPPKFVLQYLEGTHREPALILSGKFVGSFHVIFAQDSVTFAQSLLRPQAFAVAQ
jgi:hypothetical protein